MVHSLSKVKFTITGKDGVKRLIKEVEMSDKEQKSFVHYLDDHYKKARVDDLK